MGLFEMNKTAFEGAVRECSERLGRAYPPTVSITDVPCPYSLGNEVAHIHPYQGIICIWKKKLLSLNLDEIREVAAHEVAHLVSVEHDGKHAQAQAELELGIWHPPPGTVAINGGKKSNSKGNINDKKTNRRKKACSYYSCVKRTNLTLCIHCGKNFCEQHLNPKNPHLPPFKSKSRDMLEWRSLGHPCPEYPEYLKQKEKENLDERWNALEKMRPMRPDPEKLKNTSKWFSLPKSPSAEPVEPSPKGSYMAQHRAVAVKAETLSTSPISHCKASMWWID